MPSDKKTEAVTAAEVVFRKSVEDQYELTKEFVDDVCVKFCAAVQSLAESATSAAPKRRSTSKPKKQRKKSAYNVYVREMMKTEKIQELNHKQKMGAIADEWKLLEDADKVPYNEMAAVENAVTATVPAVVAEETTE
jgi:hypothetical protein